MGCRRAWPRSWPAQLRVRPMNGTRCAISAEMKATIAREAPARSCCTYATPTEKERRQTTQRRSQGARYQAVQSRQRRRGRRSWSRGRISTRPSSLQPRVADNRLIAEGWRYQLSRDRRSSTERARSSNPLNESRAGTAKGLPGGECIRCGCLPPAWLLASGDRLPAAGRRDQSPSQTERHPR